MRHRLQKFQLSTEALVEFIKERGNPQTLAELMLSFKGTKEEVQYALFIGVQVGSLLYYPAPSERAHTQKARWGFNARKDIQVAGPRISPLTDGELKYDLFSHARLAKGFRRQ
jgi:hypothetical protein